MFIKYSFLWVQHTLMLYFYTKTYITSHYSTPGTYTYCAQIGISILHLLTYIDIKDKIAEVQEVLRSAQFLKSID